MFVSTAKINEPCSAIKDTADVVKYILADHIEQRIMTIVDP